MVKVDVFGTGFALQAAIWMACGMAFILFGEHKLMVLFSTSLIICRLRPRRLLRNRGKRQLSRNHGPSERQPNGYHRLNIQFGVFFWVYSKLPVGRLAGTATRHVVCHGLGYCESAHQDATMIV